MWQYLNGLERPVLELMVSLRSPVLNTVFASLTDLGTIVQALILFGVIYLMYDERLGVLGAVSSIATASVVGSLKYIFQRDLPLQYAVQGVPEYLIPYGFPSGHTAVAFASATILYLELDRPGRYVLPVVAGLVGFSRLYLGVHYPTDILAGAVIGTGLAYVFYDGRKEIYKLF